MHFKEAEFDGMFFGCYGVAKAKDIENLDLLNVPKVPAHFRLSFIKYHLFLYDKGSPLPKKIQNFKRRQKEAVRLAGIDEDRYREEVEQMNALTYEGQPAFLFSILKEQNDVLFSSIVSNEKVYYDLVNSFLEDYSDAYSEDPKRKLDAQQKKAKLLEEQDVIMNRVLDLRDRFYGGINAESREQLERIRPENVYKRFVTK